MRASRGRGPGATGAADAARLESYPHPYPTGWYRLWDGSALRAGELRYIECLGRHLVLWRSDDGKAHVMDAFCPHLGANLSFGRVRGACIECPFHRWRFTGDGRAAHVPYSDHIPEGVLAETFPVQEVHGQIFMFHACDGGRQSATEAPPYPVPRIQEVDDGTFVYRGAYNAGRVRMHILEFAENAADSAHFEAVHSHLRIPWTRIRIPGFTLRHRTDWETDPGAPSRMVFTDETTMHVGGRPIEGGGGSARVSYCGPGSLVQFRIAIEDRGEIELWQTHLPVGALEQQVHYRWFADRRLPRWLVWYVVGNWISQWFQDIEIWENKRYARNPRLCRDDGRMFQMRRWYWQFLPEDHARGSSTPSAIRTSDPSGEPRQ